MDKHHFVRNVPLYKYTALTKWFYFFTCLLIVCLIGLCIVDIPLVWQLYQKKALYNKQRNIYTKEQEISLLQQKIQSEIKILQDQIDSIYPKKKSIINFLKIVLENQFQFTLTSIKQTSKMIGLEGVASDMNSITDGLKKLEEKTHYTVNLQTVTRNNATYVFHAVCRAKK